ncbi:MAG: helix-turn-helix domain-containing protein, partial [Clostridia bacterium]|nr:helix-turn-helix domain-containing protein [Clostridia bacterium]
MARKSVEIKLSSAEINILNNLVLTTSDPVLSRRASVILACAEGMSNKAVSEKTGMNETDVGHWRNL